MNKKTNGLIYLLLSTIIYGLFGIFSRYIGKFGPFSQGYIRYGIVILIISFFFLSKKIIWKKIEKKDFKWFLLWILPASFQPILTFIAFNHLSIGITYFLLYSTMVLGGIISGKVFFNEKFNQEKLISIILVFTGLVLIYQADLALIRNIYVSVAIISGLIVGFWNTLSKKVSNNYPELQMIFLDSLSTLTIGAIGAVIVGEKLPQFQDTASWWWIIVFAALGVTASFLLIRGFKNIEAQIGSLIMPTEVAFASFFGFIFFGKILQLQTYIGGLIITTSSVLPNLISLYNRNRQRLK